MKPATASKTYTFDHSHFKLPDGFPLGDCHGMATDKRDHVYVLQQNGDEKHPAVLEFDPAGKFVKGWGNRFANGGHGLAYDKRGDEEFLYVVDYHQGGRVVKCTLEGKELLEIKGAPKHSAYPGGRGYTPTDCQIAPNGDIIVTDGYGAGLIHTFNAKGVHQRTFGWKGKDNGQFDCPHGIAIDARGSEPVLLVADRANVRVQVLTLEGEHKQTIISRGLRYPCTVRVHGNLTIIPDLFGAVLIWDDKYNHIATLGAHPDMRPGQWPSHVAGYPSVPREDRIDGRFISPHGITRDSKGNIYVGEWLRDGGRLTKLSPA
jgi:DNA-binding beta-propeller fold protein YncE